MRRLGLALAVTLGLLLPGAAARPVDDSMEIQGVVEVEGGTLSGDVLAAYIYMDDQLVSFRLEADWVRIRVYEAVRAQPHPNVTLDAPSKTLVDRTIKDASVTLNDLADTHWVGIHPAGLSLDLAGLDVVDLQPTTQYVYGWASDDSFAPDQRYFGHPVAEPHVLMMGAGRAVMEGAGALHVYGPNLVVARGEETRTYATGDDGGWPDVRSRWAHVEFRGARLVFDTGAPFDAALAAAHAADARSLSFTIAGADATRQRLDGVLDADLQPAGPGDASLGRLALQGHVEDPVQSAAATETRALGGSAWPAIVAVAVAAGGVPAVAYGIWRRRRHPEPTVEDCVAYATLAADAGQPARAVDWLRRAQRLAPGSARLRMDEAQYLAMTGAVDEAVAAYAAAHDRTQDGTAAFEAALLLAQAGRADEAEAWLARSLERSPELAWGAERERGFVELHGREAFERAVADALRALGQD